jgi:hypothetical protein
MKTKLLASFFILHSAFFLSPSVAAPAGKTQHLTAPDQTPQGLAKSDWANIRAAYEAGRHAFQPVAGQDGVWQARNPGQQWLTRFDGRGFVAEPKGGGWQWGLELERYGFPGAERVISGVSAVKAEGQRLTYGWDAVVQEWFVNDPRGLEHGFTVRERPIGFTEGNEGNKEARTSTGAPQPGNPLPLKAPALAPSFPSFASVRPDSPLLHFTLAVRGSLVAKVAVDGQGLLFSDASGATVINYSGLKVTDADGKVLPSRFAPSDSQPPVLRSASDEGGSTLAPRPSSLVTLQVDDRGARYPLTIDPIAQQAYLKSGNNGGATDDNFGQSVAVSGDTVVVGANKEDSSTTGINSTPNESAADAGAAYVFVRSGTTWSQQAYLKASNTGAGDYFGCSVAVSGDTVVVGAYNEDSSTTGINSTPNEGAANAGAAYVFVRNGTTWSQQAYLKASNTGGSDYFGGSVAVSGDTVLVGAGGEDSSTTGVNSTPNESASASGAAYVFVRSGATWSQQAYLKASNTGVNDNFGYSVSVSSDTVVIGAFWEDSSTTGVDSTPNESAADAGAAYVFVRSGTTWSQQAYLKASNTGAGDLFGCSVAVSGDTVVVGAYNEDSSTTGVNGTPNESAANAGAAYVFVRSGTTWSQQAYLKASNTGTDDNFGYSVAVSGDTLVVTATAEDSSATGVDGNQADNSASSSGAAYVFVRSGTTWSQQAYLKASNTGAGDVFGVSVAMADDTVVVGARQEDSNTTGVNSTPNESAANSGAAYVFIRSGTTWSQQAYLKASNTEAGPGAGDYFGYSVAVSGDTVVVGAPYEDSSTTGVNSTPNESAADAGAAYVFVRSETTWSQQAYLKASNTGAGDRFGYSVAVSGDTVVIGAYYEDSNATGVNGNQADNSASNAGAAYVFVRSGTTWTQQAYLKASNTGGGDWFGYSVAVSGDTVVVGAYGEDSNAIGVNGNQADNSESNAGAAYVFVRSGTTWTQQAYLKASQVKTGDNFGLSVAVSGDTVVVGAFYEDSSTTGVNSTPNEGAPDSGAAYVFVRSGTTWSQQAYLKASNTGTGDNFGLSVAVSGNTVVVGANYEDSSTTGVNSTPNESATDSGAAYVFVRSGTTWSQQAYLKASNTGAGDHFGWSVAVSGDTVVVGAPYEDSSTTGVNSTPNESATDAGAAYVFVRIGTTWSQQAYLKASNTGANDWFGYSVAVSGDTVVVGARQEDSSTTGVNSTPDESAADSGAAYVFTGFPAPEIAVEQPAGTDLVDGTATVSYGTVLVGATSDLIFTIKNTGTVALTGLGITIDGANAAMFTVTASPTAPVSGPSGSTTFTVRFAPTSAGAKTAALHLASNDSNENPFDITLTGTGNNAPVANLATYARSTNMSLKILIADLRSSFTSDPDGDERTLDSVGSGTNNAAIWKDDTYIYYEPSDTDPYRNTTDHFSYQVSDGRGGIAANAIRVTVVTGGDPGSQGGNLDGIETVGSHKKIKFWGIHNYAYRVQRTEALNGQNTVWTDLPGTATQVSPGYFEYEDTSPPEGTACYRTVWP